MHFATFASVKGQLYKFQFPEGSHRDVRWNDEMAYPPLEPRSAVAVARGFMNGILPNYGITLRSIRLSQAWGPGQFDCYWYYDIEWEIPDLEEFGDAELVQIPVLMNGRLPSYSPVEGINDTSSGKADA